jgi:hypothetical protein
VEICREEEINLFSRKLSTTDYLVKERIIIGKFESSFRCLRKFKMKAEFR